MSEGKLRLGIAGFGGAAGGDIRSATKSGYFDVVAAADPDPIAQARFAEQYNAPSCESVSELYENFDLDAVLIATPTRLHEEQTLQALDAGLHVLVEKPMATSLEEAERMIAAAKEKGLVLMVNHKRSVDPTIIAMWKIARSGDLGRVRAVHRWHFNDWFYRPRGEDERDPAAGGVVLRQGAHEFDIIRLLADSSTATRMRGLTGEYDADKPGEGAYYSWIDYEDGMIATSFFGGYGHFLSEEFLIGPLDPERSGRSKRRLLGSVSNAAEEADLKRRSVGDPNRVIDGGVNGVYGYTLVNCEGGDMRPSPNAGVWVYDDTGRHEIGLEGTTGTDLMAIEFHRAIAEGQPALHDGAWGLGVLELCSGIRESGRLQREVELSHQGSGVTVAADALLGDHKLTELD